jgi:hypothetical protein
LDSGVMKKDCDKAMVVNGDGESVGSNVDRRLLEVVVVRLVADVVVIVVVNVLVVVVVVVVLGLGLLLVAESRARAVDSSRVRSGSSTVTGSSRISKHCEASRIGKIIISFQPVVLTGFQFRPLGTLTTMPVFLPSSEIFADL